MSEDDREWARRMHIGLQKEIDLLKEQAAKCDIGPYVQQLKSVIDKIAIAEHGLGRRSSLHRVPYMESIHERLDDTLSTIGMQCGELQK